ncbi:MAG: methionine biosynthesis protein MetW [Candidatus Omnitrophica bacterium]|jgi:methionine biosynthesis protein MetW|nr:methionine biosynthesis protein MetW [Candidatus Omnitrophota bacterium]
MKENEIIKGDHKAILDMVEQNSSVLDLGCGGGELLELLTLRKNVRGQGIEIDEQAIYRCVARGLSVLHGDIDTGLSEYKDKAFDYVILNQSLQQLKHVETVLFDALRVGKKVIVGFPNFAYYRARLRLFLRGRVPITASLPYTWYETPNLHFLSTLDFLDYCKEKKIKIELKVYLAADKPMRILPNFFANIGIFLISK